MCGTWSPRPSALMSLPLNSLIESRYSFFSYLIFFFFFFLSFLSFLLLSYPWKEPLFGTASQPLDLQPTFIFFLLPPSPSLFFLWHIKLGSANHLFCFLPLPLVFLLFPLPCGTRLLRLLTYRSFRLFLSFLFYF